MPYGPNDHRAGEGPKATLVIRPKVDSDRSEYEANDMTAPTPTRRFRRHATAVIAGALLLLLVAQPVLAVEWGSTTRLSSLENYRPRIFRTGPSSALTVYQRGTNAYARRSVDSGKTWSAPVKIASALRLNFSAAGYGSKVDIAYVRQVTTSTGTTSNRLYYRRSLDGGATWQASRAMTSSSSNIVDQAVARHSSGRVSIAWTGYSTGRLYLRTSADGGATFGSARYIGKTANWEPGAYPMYYAEPTIAIGTGVTYIAYLSATNTMSVRRTTDNGMSWSSPIKMTSSTDAPFELVATGSDALLAYTSTASGTMQAVYRRTTNKGATWSGGKALSASTNGRFSMSPQFALHGGTLAVVFKHGTPGASPVWYRQSSDFGNAWSPLARISEVLVTDSDPEPAGVAILDGIRLAGYNENRGVGSEGLWIRRGQ